MNIQNKTIETTQKSVSVAGQIRAARDAKGLSRKALGERISVSEKTIEKWETGERQPPVKRLQDLSVELEVPASYFVDGTGTLDVFPEIETTAPENIPEDTEAYADTVSSAFAFLDELDEIREAGFVTPRSATTLIAKCQDALKQLEADDLLEVAEMRGLHSDDCPSLTGILEIFGLGFDKGQEFCGNIEERIIDTAIFGVDLYWIERKSLLELIDKYKISHPDEWAVWPDWGSHEFFVPFLRHELRAAAIVGKTEPFEDAEMFPRRVVEVMEDD